MTPTRTTPTQAIPIEVLREHQYKQTWLPYCHCEWSGLPGKNDWFGQWLAHLSQFAIPVAQPAAEGEPSAGREERLKELAEETAQWVTVTVHAGSHKGTVEHICRALQSASADVAQEIENALAAARNALEQVEWVESEYDGRTYSVCPWCKADNLPGRELKHKKWCQRESARAQLSKLEKGKP